ncbi:flagellar hook-basal body complex protein FliE [Methylovorus sp. MM2]|uniref:flagellar hook-basal body complex protein FliE n=1 Tax=Methylovorus sp. MM2 TaxID=1848038 RepID=UPI0007DEBFD4|nr:flagellar hook-basal body complex protein FliE [Methylovorus sp. MM2]OAM51256.1 flagellar hook-basal body complex protein FliE [Methylovorus sp. MM2]
MTINAIDSGRIEAMLAQLKAAAQKPASESTAAKGGAALANIQANQETKRVDFSDALKSSLDNVNKMQIDAESMGKNFAMGDDKVSLSDVMIAGQKANISFQATIQVRNKLVSAYHDIMNMAI